MICAENHEKGRAVRAAQEAANRTGDWMVAYTLDDDHWSWSGSFYYLGFVSYSALHHVVVWPARKSRRSVRAR